VAAGPAHVNLRVKARHTGRETTPEFPVNRSLNFLAAAVEFRDFSEYAPIGHGDKMGAELFNSPKMNFGTGLETAVLPDYGT
jgi:hypothetical protein